MLNYEANGVLYEEEYQTGTSAFKYKDGETVRIIYHKDDPKRITIENDKSTILLSITFILIGAAIILSALGII